MNRILYSNCKKPNSTFSFDNSFASSTAFDFSSIFEEESIKEQSQQDSIGVSPSKKSMNRLEMKTLKYIPLTDKIRIVVKSMTIHTIQQTSLQRENSELAQIQIQNVSKLMPELNLSKQGQLSRCQLLGLLKSLQEHKLKMQISKFREESKKRKKRELRQNFKIL